MRYQNYNEAEMPHENARAETPSKSHSISLDNRKRLTVDGVLDVIRFDDLSAELSTALGDLIVDGEELRIEVFDTEKGSVTLTGHVRTLDYVEKNTGTQKGDKRRGFFGKR